MSKKEYRYFVSKKIGEAPKPRRRTTIYDRILDEFMQSGEQVGLISEEKAKEMRINIVSLRRKARKKGLPLEVYNIRKNIWIRRKTEA